MSFKIVFISLFFWGWYFFRVLVKNSLGYSDSSKFIKKECNISLERSIFNFVNVRIKTDKEGKLIITWDVSLWGEGGGKFFGMFLLVFESVFLFCYGGNKVF